MENIKNNIESLLKLTESYGKTNIELIKLKAVDKSGDVISTFFSNFLLLSLIIFLLFTLTVAFSLWIGELIGKTYYGFLVVAGFYALITGIYFIFRLHIKRQLKNNVIQHLLN